jgi:hypothetical protein
MIGSMALKVLPLTEVSKMQGKDASLGVPVKTYLYSLRSHIRRLTGELNSPMPVIDTAHQHMLTARAIHLSQTNLGKSRYKVLDTGALIAASRIAAGLDGLDSRKVSVLCAISTFTHRSSASTPR